MRNECGFPQQLVLKISYHKYNAIDSKKCVCYHKTG